MSTRTTFQDLNIGDEFDFISPNHMLNSFYDRCTKTGRRSYDWYCNLTKRRERSRVGTVKVAVYHVEPAKVQA